MKIFFLIIQLFFLSNFLIVQSLSVKDFERIYSYSNNKFLLKKGFSLTVADTITPEINTIDPEIKKYTFIKSKPKEILEVSYIRHREGARNFGINYYIASEAGYKNFITSINKTKFKYSKRRKIYTIFIDSYSGAHINPKGQTFINGGNITGLNTVNIMVKKYQFSRLSYKRTVSKT
ncbi:MAG: hypothetical protein IPJ81_00335 [Chitinophagaceae bacterium]|nr:hypothetical protein [Chitinophagaceae bacterium]